MKKLIFALNSFLEAYDECDFYSCELKNNRVLLFGSFNKPLADKLESCGFKNYSNSGNYSFKAGVVTIILVPKYRTNGHVK